MSINVDKMNSKHEDSLHKSKPVMKRRKKNSSASDLSSDSLSPKKRVPNGFADDYRSSPETTFNSSYHSIPMNGSLNTTNGHNLHHYPHHHHMNGSAIDPTNDLNTMNVASQSGSIRSVDCESPRHSATVNHHNHHHHYDDSDSASSVNRGSVSSSVSGSSSGRRQPRTPEDFYLFCQFILEYANYNEMCSQEALRSSTHSPLDSTGSATESTTSAVNEESNHATSSTKELDDGDGDGKDFDGSNTLMNDTSTEDVSKTMNAIDASSTNEDEDSDIDADSYNLVTCYCGKPYAGRPMIECSCCLTWLHLSCAKIRRKNIPEIFKCVKCAKSTGPQQQQQQQQQQQHQQQPLSAPTSPIPTNHPKDLLQSNEPKENNRSKKSTASNTSQTRSDKLENNILQPLNVSAAAYETGANNIDNIKTTSTVSSIAVKYK